MKKKGRTTFRSRSEDEPSRMTAFTTGKERKRGKEERI